MQNKKRAYVVPRVEQWLLSTRLTSILENFSGKGDIVDYEEAFGFDGDPAPTEP